MNTTTLVALRLYRQLGCVPSQAQLAEVAGLSARGVAKHLVAAVEGGWLTYHGHGLYVPARFPVISAPLRAALDEAAAGAWEDSPTAGELLAVALGGVDLDDAEGQISSEIARAWRDLAAEEARHGVDPGIAHRLLRDEYEAEGVVDPAAWRAADQVLTYGEGGVDAAAAAAYAAVGEAVTRARCLRLA